MGLFDFFKSKPPSGVTFDDQIRWMLCSYKNCERVGINSHYDIGSISWHTDLFFGQYVFCYTRRSAHWSDKEHYKYFKHQVVEYRCYLVDDKFVPDKNFSEHSTDFCYPQIIQHNYNEFWYKEGPWIDKLKLLMDEHGIKTSFIQNKQWVNEQELLQQIEQQNKKQCCENRKRSVLENFK